MAVYTSEAIDIEDLVTLIENNWDTKSGGEVPQPEFIDMDSPRFDPSLQWANTPRPSVVFVQLSEITERQEGYAYEYVQQRAQATLEIHTRRNTASAGGTDRQYLHDVKRELRRIVYSNKHSLANWQVMAYGGFEEVYEDSQAKRFHGRIRLELLNTGIKVPSEEVASDQFNRANEELSAGDWAEEAGDWEVVSNQAALQDATVNAVARFTAATFKSNHRLQSDLVTAAGMEAGVVFRWQDASNYWRAVLVESGGTRNVRLIERSGGADTTRADVLADDGLPNWADGDTVELAVDLYNDCMSVQFNDLAVINLIDTTLQTATGYGLFSNADQSTRFNNFFVFEAGGANR